MRSHREKPCRSWLVRRRPTGCAGRWRSRGDAGRPIRARPCTRRPTSETRWSICTASDVVGPAGERDRLARVRVVEHAALRVAGAWPHDEIGEVSAQDVVAGVAAVVAELDVHVVAPRLTEPVAGEVGVAVPALDRQPVQRRARRVEGRVARRPDSGLRCRRRWRRRRRRCRGLVLEVQPDRHSDSEHEQSKQHGNDAAHIAVLALKPVEC